MVVAFSVSAVLPAAGSGTRMRMETPKQVIKEITELVFDFFVSVNGLEVLISNSWFVNNSSEESFDEYNSSCQFNLIFLTCFAPKFYFIVLLVL